MTIHQGSYNGRNAPRKKNGGAGNGHSPIPITGRELTGGSKGDAGARAGRAAMLVCGEAQLVTWSVPQATAVTVATMQLTYEALRLTPAARARVAAGEITLADAARGNGLVNAWLMASAEEKAALGATVGVDVVWDAAISPSI